MLHVAIVAEPSSNARELVAEDSHLPAMPRATSIAFPMSARELTKPLSCTMPLKVLTLTSADFRVRSLGLTTAGNYRRPSTNRTITINNTSPRIPLGA